RATSGDSARCSARTNSASRITPSRAQPRRVGEVAPHAYASLSTAMRAVSAGAIKNAPFQSKRLSSGRSLVGGSTNHPSTVPARPTGTLIQNTQRQSSASSTRPPIAGPALNPTACAADWMRSARPRRAGPAAATTMDAVRRQQRRADALNDPKRDEHRQVRSKAAERRAQHEQQKAAGVQKFASHHVGKPAEDRQE